MLLRCFKLSILHFLTLNGEASDFDPYSFNWMETYLMLRYI